MASQLQRAVPLETLLVAIDPAKVQHRVWLASGERRLAYLVASPRLLEVNSHTIPQMRFANALYRFVELGAIR